MERRLETIYEHCQFYEAKSVDIPIEKFMYNVVSKEDVMKTFKIQDEIIASSILSEQENNFLRTDCDNLITMIKEEQDQLKRDAMELKITEIYPDKCEYRN